MTIAEELYHKCLWGKTPVFTVLEQVADTEFKKGSNTVKCNWNNKDKCLYFEEYNQEGKIIFSNRLYQSGEKY